MTAAARILGHPALLAAVQWAAAATRRLHPKRLPGPGRAWTASRDLPDVPAESFRRWWRSEGGQGEATGSHEQ